MRVLGGRGLFRIFREWCWEADGLMVKVAYISPFEFVERSVMI